MQVRPLWPAVAVAAALLPAARASAQVSGQVLLQVSPQLRRASVEVDGQPVGLLPADQLLALPPGVHRLAVVKGRWRLPAEVTVRAGVRAEVRWPRPGAFAVSYLPTLGLVLSPRDGEPLLRQAATVAIHGQHFAILGEHGTVDMATPAGCGDSVGCLDDLAQLHSLPQVFAVSARPTAAGYALSCRLFTALTGDISAERSDDCADCSAEQAKARLTALASATLQAGLSRPLGLLEISSQPPGAEVLIDGRRLGTTPYRRPTGAGEHSICIHKTGFIDYENFVDVDPARGSALDATLRPNSQALSQRP